MPSGKEGEKRSEKEKGLDESETGRASTDRKVEEGDKDTDVGKSC